MKSEEGKTKRKKFICLHFDAFPDLFSFTVTLTTLIFPFQKLQGSGGGEEPPCARASLSKATCRRASWTAWREEREHGAEHHHDQKGQTIQGNTKDPLQGNQAPQLTCNRRFRS